MEWQFPNSRMLQWYSFFDSTVSILFRNFMVQKRTRNEKPQAHPLFHYCIALQNSLFFLGLRCNYLLAQLVVDDARSNRFLFSSISKSNCVLRTRRAIMKIQTCISRNPKRKAVEDLVLPEYYCKFQPKLATGFAAVRSLGSTLPAVVYNLHLWSSRSRE